MRLITRILDYIQDCLRDVVNDHPKVGDPQPLHEEEAPRWWAWGCLALLVFVAALGIVTSMAQVWHAVAK
jgi:hypothetical protein